MMHTGKLEATSNSTIVSMQTWIWTKAVQRTKTIRNKDPEQRQVKYAAHLDARLACRQIRKDQTVC